MSNRWWRQISTTHKKNQLIIKLLEIEQQIMITNQWLIFLAWILHFPRNKLNKRTSVLLNSLSVWLKTTIIMLFLFSFSTFSFSICFFLWNSFTREPFNNGRTRLSAEQWDRGSANNCNLGSSSQKLINIFPSTNPLLKLKCFRMLTWNRRVKLNIEKLQQYDEWV